MIEPHRPTGDLILAQRLPGAADGHPRQAMLHQQHQHHHQTQHGVEKDEFQVGVVADVEKLMDGDAAIFRPAGKLEAKQRGGWHRYAVRAAGEAHPVVEHQADNFAKAEGDDGQIVAMHTQHRKAQQRPGESRHHCPQRQHRPEAKSQVLVAQRQAVGADGVKRHIAQIEQAREAHHNIQPQAKQNVDQPKNGHGQQIFCGEKRKDNGQPHQQRYYPAQPRAVARRPDVHPVIRPLKAGNKGFSPVALQQQTERQPAGHHHRHQNRHPRRREGKTIPFEHHADDRAKDN